jgi:ribosome-binding protein aMBF1 (putative translation factor)
MKRKRIAALCVLMMVLGLRSIVCGQAKANVSDEKQQTTNKASARPKPSDAERIRRSVEEFGIGKRVTVVLRNGNEYYGAITEAASESFELSEIDLNQKIPIAYSDVKKVRSGFGNPNPYNGKRWHPGWHIAAAAAVVGITVALIIAGATASR